VRVRRYGAAIGAAVLAALGVAACGDKAQTESASAAHLSAVVDSVLPRLQVIAGLPKRGEIQLDIQSRDAVREYIEERMREELPDQELEAIRQTYIAFGLVPADLDLKALLVDLYTEQVVGYYDPPSKKLFVVAGVPEEQVRPVLVHELVHALQDQHADLDSLISRSRGNDRQTAAQAAIEGHATMVMLAYLAEAQSGSPVDPRSLPDIGEQIRPNLEAQNSQFPVFQRAPRVLRETLLFPYAGGAAFVQKLWRRPLDTGFGDPYPAPIGDRLPESTEQVMNPDSRFLVNRDDPTELALSGGSGTVVRENVLGQLETAILLEEHLGEQARQFANGWDGDRYRLIDTGNGNALVWYSVWDDAGAADRFADAYRRVAAKRTDRNIAVERLEIDARPAVRVIDAESSVSVAPGSIPAASIVK